jgi:hypothetical protein
MTGTARLLVDGTNLLHQLSSGPERQPPAALIGRLRAAIPPEVAIELVFDGPAERGLRGERIAHGVSVRYGGRHTADTILVTLVEDVAMAAGAPAGGGSLATESSLVVTDDRALRYAIQHRGARTLDAGRWPIDGGRGGRGLPTEGDISLGRSIRVTSHDVPAVRAPRRWSAKRRSRSSVTTRIESVASEPPPDGAPAAIATSSTRVTRIVSAV